MGYQLNPKTRRYERQVRHPVSKKMVTLVAVRAKQDKKQDVFYVCDPAVHKDHLYIGVLNKSMPPLPCCFKKNQLHSENVTIRKTMEEVLDGTLETKDTKKKK
eukprot:16032-Eustigmatos_ZCMA.PRE.1